MQNSDIRHHAPCHYRRLGVQRAQLLDRIRFQTTFIASGCVSKYTPNNYLSERFITFQTHIFALACELRSNAACRRRVVVSYAINSNALCWFSLPFATVYGDVRLVNGPNTFSGRVEFYTAGSTWGTVCDDNFDASAASVVCRQLGFTGGTVRPLAYFGRGTLPIVLDDVSCYGTESRLNQCASRGVTDCSHAEDVGVECIAPSEFLDL